MNKRIGNNLKKIRSISSFTQEEVAAALGINRSAYSNYECGNQGMPVDLLEKTADLFGCELYVFFEEKLSEDIFLATTLRIDELNSNDLQEIVHFKDILKSYIKMDLLAAAL